MLAVVHCRVLGEKAQVAFSVIGIGNVREYDRIRVETFEPCEWWPKASCLRRPRLERGRVRALSLRRTLSLLQARSQCVVVPRLLESERFDPICDACQPGLELRLLSSKLLDLLVDIGALSDGCLDFRQCLDALEVGKLLRLWGKPMESDSLFHV